MGVENKRDTWQYDYWLRVQDLYFTALFKTNWGSSISLRPAIVSKMRLELKWTFEFSSNWNSGIISLIVSSLFHFLIWQSAEHFLKYGILFHLLLMTKEKIMLLFNWCLPIWCAMMKALNFEVLALPYWPLLGSVFGTGIWSIGNMPAFLSCTAKKIDSVCRVWA
jgi:hypothetical protein